MMTAVLWIPRALPDAHVTILHPFVTRNQFREAKKKLREICDAIPNFTVRLARVNHFDSSRTSWVEPEPADVFRKIHDALQRAFPICRSKHPFVPHLTIARETSWKAVEVQADELALVRDDYRIEKTFRFSEPGY